MKREHVLPTVADTQAFGRELAGVLQAGDLVVLAGPLGAGKTALPQGLGAGHRSSTNREDLDRETQIIM